MRIDGNWGRPIDISDIDAPIYLQLCSVDSWSTHTSPNGDATLGVGKGQSDIIWLHSDGGTTGSQLYPSKSSRKLANGGKPETAQ